MNWYLAKIVFKVNVGDEKYHSQFDEQLRLIMASDETHAFHKARQTGMQESMSFSRDENLVQWNFINVTELYKLSSMLDGAELYSTIHKPEDPMLFIESVHKKAANILKNSTHKFLQLL